MSLFSPDPHWRERVPVTPPWHGVLMCPPTFFDVLDEKNVFMRGQLGRVDRGLAQEQWHGLAETYRSLGRPVHLLPAEPGCEDMVFCANGACLLPREQGGADAVLSRMNHPSRQAEVEGVAATLRGLDIECHGLPPDVGRLEGHGDVLVIPGRRLALGGHGGRSSEAALRAVEQLTGVPVVPLALHGQVFYHLDTCLAVLDERTVLLHPPAFLPRALQTLETLFERMLVAPPREAAEHLAVNVHALPDGHVLHPAQATATATLLADAGYAPVSVDVSEFHRSGGSVFCMRMDLPRPAAS